MKTDEANETRGGGVLTWLRNLVGVTLLVVLIFTACGGLEFDGRIYYPITYRPLRCVQRPLAVPLDRNRYSEINISIYRYINLSEQDIDKQEDLQIILLFNVSDVHFKIDFFLRIFVSILSILANHRRHYTLILFGQIVLRVVP